MGPAQTLDAAGAGADAKARPPEDHRRDAMAKGQKKSNKEARKPKKEVKKSIAANPSTKGTVVKD
jgi:hypothetical protein